MNNIEEQLWNYIDGICTPEEASALAALIKSDEVYRSKYEELLQLNQEFKGLEMEEPSMAFTYKVMENIRTENSLKPLKATINKRIILSIAAFFVIAIAAALILGLSSINWSVGKASLAIQMPEQLTMDNMKSFFTAPVLKGFLFFDVVMGLFLLDGYLRKKQHLKHL